MIGISTLVYGTLVVLAVLRGQSLMAGSMITVFTMILWLNGVVLDMTSAAPDVPFVGKHLSNPKLKGTAVVCGGSIGAVLCSAMLAHHFERVIVIDDEQQTGKTLKRTHVWQFSRQHALSSFVSSVLERLFPGIDLEEEVRNLGGRISNWTTVPSVSLDGARVKFCETRPPPKAYDVITLTRPTFETWIRNRVLAAHPNIEVQCGRVTGLELDTRRADRISAVSVALPEGEQSLLDASLVVDATGATSAGKKWLHRLGYDMPTTSYYRPHLLYIDFSFHLDHAEWARMPVPPGLDKDKIGILDVVIAGPEQGVCAFAIITRYEPQHEGDAAMIGVAYGAHTRDPSASHWPTTPDLLLNSLRAANAGPYGLACMEQLVKSERWSCHKAVIDKCSRVNYDKVKRLPRNFVATGDAIMQLNPTFGQGITQAARNAVTLNRFLYDMRRAGHAEAPINFASRFFEKCLRRNDTLNDADKLRDAAWSEFEPMPGDVKPDTSGPMSKFISLFGHATHTDPKCADAYNSLINGTLSPLELFKPEILCRIGWAYCIR